MTQLDRLRAARAVRVVRPLGYDFKTQPDGPLPVPESLDADLDALGGGYFHCQRTGQLFSEGPDHSMTPVGQAETHNDALFVALRLRAEVLTLLVLTPREIISPLVCSQGDFPEGQAAINDAAAVAEG